MNETKDVQRRGTEFFVTWKDRSRDAALGEAELTQLERIADALIPGGTGWPVPSTTELRFYIGEGARRAADLALLREVLQAVGPALGDRKETVDEALRALASAKPLAFRVLQEFVYYAYYAQPEVVRAIRSQLHCDYISPPQPHGYAMPADEGLSPSRKHKFVATGKVRRVDLGSVDLTESTAKGG